MNTAHEELVLVDAFDLRAGDRIVFENEDGVKHVTVTQFERLGNSVRVVTDAGTDDELEPGSDVMLVVPVHDVPPDGVTLYKASGAGVLHCRCVYRLERGEWVRLFDSDPHCPSLGHGALDEED